MIVMADLLSTVVFRDRLYHLYMERLDAWVNSGGPQDKLQSDVIPDCTKLALSQAGPVEGVLMLFDRDEYDFRSDVCFQITVNRVYPQPKLQDSKLVNMVCDNKNDLFGKLCKHAGLR